MPCKTLRNTMIDKASEQWRMECEARHVLSLGELMARRAYLGLIEARRGADARKALEAVVRVEWSQREVVRENDVERLVIDNKAKVSNG